MQNWVTRLDPNFPLHAAARLDLNYRGFLGSCPLVQLFFLDIKRDSDRCQSTR